MQNAAAKNSNAQSGMLLLLHRHPYVRYFSYINTKREGNFLVNFTKNGLAVIS